MNAMKCEGMSTKDQITLNIFSISYESTIFIQAREYLQSHWEKGLSVVHKIR